MYLSHCKTSELENVQMLFKNVRNNVVNPKYTLFYIFENLNLS